MGYIFSPILSPLKSGISNGFKRSIDTGAKAVLHVATSPALEAVSGQLFSDTASGFTEAAGCKRKTPELCGQATQPKALKENSSLDEMWQASELATQDWSQGIEEMWREAEKAMEAMGQEIGELLEEGETL